MPVVSQHGYRKLRSGIKLPDRSFRWQGSRGKYHDVALSDGFFDPRWNRRHTILVQITAAETVGAEGRGRFYKKTGAPRHDAHPVVNVPAQPTHCRRRPSPQ
ncbi:MAG: hypothetical protein WAV27_11780 [Xanthobacteraceae bacterium]|nr:hypothetical protein [Beijerinckiaceae bacterium]